MNPARIVVLISGNGSNLQAIIDSIQQEDIKAEIAAVISNKSSAFGLQRASAANIETSVIDHTVFESRDAFDQALANVIDEHSPDLVVLAGFMRILTDFFVNHYAGRLINIHPSLLPKYRGLNTHKRALKNNDSQHGASVHFVTPELDSGAVLIQGIVPIIENDTENSLAERVHQVEHIIYPEAIKILTSNRVELKNDTIIINDDELSQPKTVQLTY